MCGCNMERRAKTLAKIIAISGKGGVGKTSIAALIIKVLLKDKGKKILAIDGDPAVGFSMALGLNVTKTLDDVRNEVIAAAKSGEKEAKAALLQRINYEVLDAMVEENGFAFLAIGRPESKGCYCKINEYLKDIIADLEPNFDYIVIDGEAGIEQINRRVMERVTHLLMVSDASQKGIGVVKTVHTVAQKAMMFDKAGLLFNRLRSEQEIKNSDIKPLSLLGCLLENEAIRTADIQGNSILGIPDDETVQRLQNILMKFLN